MNSTLKRKNIKKKILSKKSTKQKNKNNVYSSNQYSRGGSGPKMSKIGIGKLFEFDKLDKDGDGTISKEEFLAQWEKIGFDTEEDAKKYFDELDKDGNGKLDKSEFTALSSKLAKYIENINERRAARYEDSLKKSVENKASKIKEQYEREQYYLKSSREKQQKKKEELIEKLNQEGLSIEEKKALEDDNENLDYELAITNRAILNFPSSIDEWRGQQPYFKMFKQILDQLSKSDMSNGFFRDVYDFNVQGEWFGERGQKIMEACDNGDLFGLFGDEDKAPPMLIILTTVLCYSGYKGGKNMGNKFLNDSIEHLENAMKEDASELEKWRYKPVARLSYYATLVFVVMIQAGFDIGAGGVYVGVKVLEGFGSLGMGGGGKNIALSAPPDNRLGPITVPKLTSSVPVYNGKITPISISGRQVGGTDIPDIIEGQFEFANQSAKGAEGIVSIIDTGLQVVGPQILPMLKNIFLGVGCLTMILSNVLICCIELTSVARENLWKLCSEGGEAGGDEQANTKCAKFILGITNKVTKSFRVLKNLFIENFSTPHIKPVMTHIKTSMGKWWEKHKPKEAFNFLKEQMRTFRYPQLPTNIKGLITSYRETKLKEQLHFLDKNLDTGLSELKKLIVSQKALLKEKYNDDFNKFFQALKGDSKSDTLTLNNFKHFIGDKKDDYIITAHDLWVLIHNNISSTTPLANRGQLTREQVYNWWNSQEGGSNAIGGEITFPVLTKELKGIYTIHITNYFDTQENLITKILSEISQNNYDSLIAICIINSAIQEGVVIDTETSLFFKTNLESLQQQQQNNSPTSSLAEARERAAAKARERAANAGGSRKKRKKKSNRRRKVKKRKSQKKRKTQKKRKKRQK